jgi:FkbM family methyltransferase
VGTDALYGSEKRRVNSELPQDMNKILFVIQRAIKKVARTAGLEIRYAFQNPSITDPRIYSRWLAPDQVRCIFDVGANIGQSARSFATGFPNSIVHSFEPFAGAYSRLERIADSSNGRIRAYQLACGDCEGSMEVVIDPSSLSQLNQLVPVTAGKPGTPDQKMRVQISTVDRICEEQRIEWIDILKTDTEGYDAKVLAGARRMLSSGRVKCVVSEIGYLNDTQHTEISEVFLLLHQFGFKMAGIYEVSYFRSRACDFSNALFVQPISKPCSGLVSDKSLP